jgi:ribulose-5-phosphate 4-epimerase/fuculose-1-phosphate aldolase
MHWSEVKASSFMEVGINDGEVKRGTGDVERSCYCIHAPIHKALPQAKVVFHTHMPFASALTRLEDPRIKEIGQTEVGMMEMIAYDDNYTGPGLDPEEGERLVKVIVLHDEETKSLVANDVRFSRADLLACSGHKNRDRLSAFGLSSSPLWAGVTSVSPFFFPASRLRQPCESA